jgi:hypothetical protein
VLHPLANLAARSQQRERLSTERVNHLGGVDAAPSGVFTAGQNISPILKCDPVGNDGAINRGIDGERKNQANMVANPCGIIHTLRRI